MTVDRRDYGRSNSRIRTSERKAGARSAVWLAQQEIAARRKMARNATPSEPKAPPETETVAAVGIGEQPVQTIRRHNEDPLFVAMDNIAIGSNTRYILAVSSKDDSADRSAQNRTTYGFIPGQKPLWGQQILSALKDNLYITLKTSKERNVRGELKGRTERGRLDSGGGACEVLVIERVDNGQSITHLTLVDVSADGKEIVGGGSLDLQVLGTSPASAAVGKALQWRGWLSVQGNPGEEIKNAIEFISHSICSNQYPLWKQV